MKTHINDVLQIAAAIVITGGLVASASPLPKTAPSITKPAIVEQVKTPEKPVEAPPVVPVPEKVVTWQDNPNHCTDAQYIAAGAPFGCIDKPVVAAAPAPVTRAASFSGDKYTWLAAAGIPQSMWADADWIISQESGWNPCAYNPGRSDCTTDFTPSTACGLVQTLPCGKAGSNWRDPVAALVWQYNYVCNSAKFQAYGPCYAGAKAYWQVHGNY